MAIRKVGIVGGGKMGAEIFKLLSDSDYDVVLWTRRQETVDALDEDLKRKLRRRAKKGGDEGARAESRLSRLTITNDLNALADVDLITESLVESLPPKREIFAALDKIVRPEAIFTTNTSSLSPSSLADVTTRPERFAGLHFFYPMSLLKFVEVIPTTRRAVGTSPEVMDVLTEFVTSLGKRPLRLTMETSAYLVNRLLASYYNEGCGIVGEGHWLPGEVDRVGKRFAMMGPCESVDHVGIDVLIEGVESADESWGEKDHVINQTRGRKEWPPVQFRLRADGRFGMKTGLGFFRYENGKQLEDPEYFQRIWPELPNYHCVPKGDENLLEKRLWYSLVLEALVVEERGVGSREDIDWTLKEILGLEKTPLAFVESEGAEKVGREVRELEAMFGPRFAPVGILKG